MSECVYVLVSEGCASKHHIKSRHESKCHQQHQSNTFCDALGIHFSVVVSKEWEQLWQKKNYQCKNIGCPLHDTSLSENTGSSPVGPANENICTSAFTSQTEHSEWWVQTIKGKRHVQWSRNHCVLINHIICPVSAARDQRAHLVNLWNKPHYNDTHKDGKNGNVCSIWHQICSWIHKPLRLVLKS